ncbi:hypothetical protein V6N11_049364 [Hibiscus sabdariffa]|uniref:RNase H type-1 domain-containing protein n=1 Tax=Hibiscus sabdariffa TaxID=183260 RepID=A0ABR2P0V5_9ROSI
MPSCRSSSMDSFGTLVGLTVSGCSLIAGATHRLFDSRVFIRTGWTLRYYARSSCYMICLPGILSAFQMFCGENMSRSLHESSRGRDFPLVVGSARRGLTLGSVPFAKLLLIPHCMLFETVVMLVRHFLWLILLIHLLPVLCRVHSPGWKRQPLSCLGKLLVVSLLSSGAFGTVGTVRCMTSNFSLYGLLSRQLFCSRVTTCPLLARPAVLLRRQLLVRWPGPPSTRSGSLWASATLGWTFRGRICKHVALLVGLQLALDHGWPSVLVETDSAQTINRLDRSPSSNLSIYGPSLEPIKAILIAHPHNWLRLIPRSTKRVAQTVASWALHCNNALFFRLGLSRADT